MHHVINLAVLLMTFIYFVRKHFMNLKIEHPWNEYWGNMESSFNMECEGENFIPIWDDMGSFEYHEEVPEGSF